MELAAVERVAAVMRRVHIWWAVAGGWAIDGYANLERRGTQALERLD